MCPAAPLPHDEPARIATLRALRLLDTPREPAFDRITRLAAHTFDAPMALISLVDVDRQWFKSRVGIDDEQTHRDISFCAWAILGDRPLVVPDATLDVRFATNPMVTGLPEVRFYAGAPLRAEDGHAIGTVCVVDTEPRPPLDEAERDALQDLAAITMNLVQRRTLDAQPAPSPRTTGAELLELDTVERARRVAMLSELLFRQGHTDGDLSWLVEPLHEDARRLHQDLRDHWHRQHHSLTVV